MSLVSEAVYNAFKPDKLNYELLRNGDSHIHWHIFPRIKNDLPVKGPVWWLDPKIMFSEDVLIKEVELEEMKFKLINELKKTLTN